MISMQQLEIQLRLRENSILSKEFQVQPETTLIHKPLLRRIPIKASLLIRNLDLGPIPI